MFTGKLIPAPATTVTTADAVGMPGAEAVIVVEPTPTLVTGIVTVMLPAATVESAGTVATPLLPEVRVTVVPPAGAAAGNVNCRN
jgi:hypothetical protein